MNRLARQQFRAGFVFVGPNGGKLRRSNARW
jgi:hypothetical protein